MKSLLTRFGVLTVASLLASGAHAQWQSDLGAPVSTADSTQAAVSICPDGAGGAIFVWEDYQGPWSAGGGYPWELYPEPKVFAQRLNAAGVSQWTVDGIAVCTATGGQGGPLSVSDGAGGAIVVFQRGGLYAQRISAAGTLQWAADGVPLCTAAGGQGQLTIAADGAGGAFAAWLDHRNGGYPDIYAARIDASGTVLVANGVPVCTAPYDQGSPMIIADGTGGAIVAWHDYRSLTATGFDIYAHRLTASGTSHFQWPPNGIPLTTAPSDQTHAVLVSDGAGGAIAAWFDRRAGYGDIYAQRISADGNTLWTGYGVGICTAPNSLGIPAVLSDGAGGAFVTWHDEYRAGGNGADIYAQRINSTGSVQWAANGIALCAAAGDQYVPRIVTDGAGGAIVQWNDHRSGTDFNIFAQRIDASGAAYGPADGVALVSGAGDQWSGGCVSDGAGGAIVAVVDDPDGNVYAGSNTDLYAQKAGPDTWVPTAIHDGLFASEMSLSVNRPNPFSAGTAMELTLRREQTGRVEVVDAAGRRVRTIDAGRLKAGVSRLGFDGRDDHGQALPSGVYFYRVYVGGEILARKMVIAR